ncbi:MAG: hypothetical protein ROO76_16525 [Terriglobia bacterium]|jgi:hypothetical protein|nr:hypothetical protein [Terriglobia bacterium]
MATDVHLEAAVEDPAQSQWLNFLPNLQGQRVLVAGKCPADVIRALRARSGMPVTSIGEENAVLGCELMSLPVRPPVSDKFSFAVIDGIAGVSEFDLAIDQVIPIFQSDVGKMVVCLAAGWSKLRLRRYARSKVRDLGFASAAYYCDPDVDKPERIISLCAGAGPALSILCPRPDSVFARVKWAFKAMFYRVAGCLNPRFGLVLIAQKEVNAVNQGSMAQLATELVNLSAKEATVVSVSQHYNGRQFLFVYDSSAKSKLRAVAKFANRRYPRFALSKREYRALSLADSVSSRMPMDSRFAPTVLFSECSSESTAIVLSAADGQSIAQLCSSREMSRNSELAGQVLAKGVRLLRRIQKEISLDPASIDFRCDHRYLENYLQLPILMSPKVDEDVQHGDFTVEHVFFDPAKNRWTVLDWEWLGRGYPFLMDVFSFLRSVRFLQPRNQGAHWKDVSFLSLQDTFFRENWFSELSRAIVSEYIAARGLSHLDRYSCFLQYLLFRCNKVRLDEVFWPHQLRDWERLTEFAVTNRNQFQLW